MPRKDNYNPIKIEAKWQKVWQEKSIYSTSKNPENKRYILDMFPYPSGASLHVGHVEGYVGTDIIVRYERMKGSSVLHPMGWDSFGLPAENYAIKTGIHPDESTHKNIETFKRQLTNTGLSYDWDREIDTSDPDFYRWTQWLFILMFRKGLAYKKLADVNWCPSCETVLANEQVVGGKCERCSAGVVLKMLNQWFLKITTYADRLISGLDDIDWLDEVKLQQKNWIGRSEGALIQFELADSTLKAESGLEVFTTAIDTIFGVTFIVLSPSHPLLAELEIPKEQKEVVSEYIEGRGTVSTNKSASKSKTASKGSTFRSERADKTGVFTGLQVVNPFNGEKVPLWVADYVLMDYGTGAVMGVPGHDARDYEFAKKYDLPIKPVVKPADNAEGASVEKDGFWDYPEIKLRFADKSVLFNSGEYDGLTSSQAKEKMLDFIEAKSFGKRKITYHLRDWLISRQRYWGAPIPMVYCKACAKDEKGECEEMPGWYTVNEAELPVLLPRDVDFRPTGQSPIARSKSFQKNVYCPNCGSKAYREVDTMDTYVDSSWYFIRFVDPSNSREFASHEEIKKWLPVDVYVGGGHVVQHLLFARFFWKVLFDARLIDKSLGDEPFLKLRAPGWILGSDSRKMSKRWNNVITPDDIIPKYGADTLRMYEMFVGPFDAAKPWSLAGVEGMWRFINRVWRLISEQKDIVLTDTDDSKQILRAQHKTVQKVTKAIEELHFNIAIASLMEFVNLLQDKVGGEVKRSGKVRCAEWDGALKTLLMLLAPFAPHMTEELWQKMADGGLGIAGGKKRSTSYEPRATSHTSIHLSAWPKFDPALVVEDMVEIPVQVNGKFRGTVQVMPELVQDQGIIEEKAREIESVKSHLAGKEVKKVVFVPGKAINFVVT